MSQPTRKKSSLVRIPRGAFWTLVYLFAITGVAAFALTQTEYGRETLRGQLVDQFNRLFEGSISIANLQGNMFNRITATDVALFDTDGHIVATVDSLIAEATLLDLFRRSVNLSSLEIHRPSLAIVKDSSGTWNLTNALTPKRVSEDSTRARWAIEPIEIAVFDGEVTFENPVDPTFRRLIGSNEARLVDLDGRGIVQFSPDSSLVEITESSATYLGNPISEASGTIAVDGDGVRVTAARLTSGRSNVDLASFYLRRGIDGRAQPSFDLVLNRSTLTTLDIKDVFPGSKLVGNYSGMLRMEKRENVTTFRDVYLESGVSNFSGDIRLEQGPDSTAFSATVRDAKLALADLERSAPFIDVSRFVTVPDLDFTGTSEGVFARSGAPLAGRGVLRGLLKIDSGQIQTEGLELQMAGDRLSIDGEVLASNIDPSVIPEWRAWPGSLSGRIAYAGPVDGTGGPAFAQVYLSSSVLAGSRIDTLSLNLAQAADKWTWQGSARALGGAISSAGDIQIGAFTSIQGNADLRSVDLTSLAHTNIPIPDATGNIEVKASGPTWLAVSGSAKMDLEEMMMIIGDSLVSIPPDEVLLTVDHPTEETTIAGLSANFGEASLSGAFTVGALLATVNEWSPFVSASIAREVDKPFARAAGEITSGPVMAPLRADSLERSLKMSLTAKMARPELIAFLLPPLASLSDDSEFEVEATVSGDKLFAFGTAQASSVSSQYVDAGPSDLTFEISATSRSDLASNLIGVAEIKSQTLTIAGQAVGPSSLRLDYANRSGRFDATSSELGENGELAIAGRLDLLPDRNRLILESGRLGSDAYRWTGVGQQILDLYSDALDVKSMEFSQANLADAGAVERISGSGVLTTEGDHTLKLAASNIQIGALSDLLALRDRVGGFLQADIELSGSVRRPEITGTVVVDSLGLDGRQIGDLRVVSRLGGSQDVVNITASVQREPNVDEGSPYGNDVSATGTIQLPGNAGTEDYALDLAVEASSVDLFFFDNIFKNMVVDATGMASGRATIGGTITRPVFEGSFDVTNGRFRLPKFNLEYLADGKLDVDADGLILRETTIRDLSAGLAEVSGRVDFNDYRFWSLDLSGRVDDLTIIDVADSGELPFYGFIKASGDATLTGPVQAATLRSENAVTSSESEVHIPVQDAAVEADRNFIVFADSSGNFPDATTGRTNIIQRRPDSERTFVEGLDMFLDITAPRGSRVNLVFDPLLGDVIEAVGSGSVQLMRTAGDFSTFGTFRVDSGNYLFTAGDLFVRNFEIQSGGTITWDGDPLDGNLEIPASYRTRASLDGLIEDAPSTRVPFIIKMDIAGRVTAPLVDLSIELDRGQRGYAGETEGIEARLNRPDQTAQYATSVLLTNTFLLSNYEQGEAVKADAPLTADNLIFNSLSQLVGNQLNRLISQAVDNLDVNVGLQQRSSRQDLDLTYGFALRLMDERLTIRGEGVYSGNQTEATNEQLRGEFLVEVLLNPNVSVEVFYRRESELLGLASSVGSSYGAGVVYQTEFTNWRRFVRRIRGREEQVSDDKATSSATKEN